MRDVGDVYAKLALRTGGLFVGLWFTFRAEHSRECGKAYSDRWVLVT